MQSQKIVSFQISYSCTQKNMIWYPSVLFFHELKGLLHFSDVSVSSSHNEYGTDTFLLTNTINNRTQFNYFSVIQSTCCTWILERWYISNIQSLHILKHFISTRTHRRISTWLWAHQLFLGIQLWTIQQRCQKHQNKQKEKFRARTFQEFLYDVRAADDLCSQNISMNNYGYNVLCKLAIKNREKGNNSTLQALFKWSMHLIRIQSLNQKPFPFDNLNSMHIISTIDLANSMWHLQLHL